MKRAEEYACTYLYTSASFLDYSRSWPAIHCNPVAMATPHNALRLLFFLLCTLQEYIISIRTRIRMNELFLFIISALVSRCAVPRQGHIHISSHWLQLLFPTFFTLQNSGCSVQSPYLRQTPQH
jgi:hypothetical protein